MRPKKSLGQNFLRDEKVLTEIIASAKLNANDNVIEVGPGEGVLSTKLNERVGKLIMIEKDEQLSKNLAKNFKFQISNFKSISNDKTFNSENKSIVFVGDILEINLPELIEKNNFGNYKLIANIPYYITSPIIRMFLETKYPPQEMILMVQREVAERICAPAGQMSLLSVSVQYYATPEILFYVDKKSFWPVPEVDSAIIKIVPDGKTPDKKTTVNFFRTVKAGFCAKRKTLSNNLTSSFQLDKKTIEEKIKKAGLVPTQRAQELNIADWKKLANLMSD